MKQQSVSALLITAYVGFLTGVPHSRAGDPSQPLEQRLDRLVLDYYPSQTEPGAAVLVMVDGKPVLRKGYGIADLDKGVKVSPDMIFRIASITKQFTAVAVLQLVQAGKVSLDDPITKYLPDFDARGKTITVENLLSHTSGLPEYAGREHPEGPGRDLKPSEVVDLVAGIPLEFDPGTRFRYRNTNYVVLGMLIEKVSSRSYADHIDSSIAKPLGLSDTRYSREYAPTPRHARGHEQQSSGKWGPPGPLNITHVYAAGALESTLDDLAEWTHLVADGKVVDAQWVARAWTPYNPTESPSDYGYGWFIRPESDERWIGHNGGINGFRSSVIWIPEKKVFVAVLCNALHGPQPDLLLRRLALEAVGRPEPERVAITMTPEKLDRYVGVYAISPEAKFTVSRRGEKLLAEAPNKSKVELFAEAEDKFFNPEAEIQFTFTMENGKATQMTLRRAGKDSVARRVD